MFDKFVNLNHNVLRDVHSLLGMTCLCISLKMNDNCVLSFDQAVILCHNHSGVTYNVEMFAMLEFEIFKTIGFDLMFPTAVDLLYQVLYLKEMQDVVMEGSLITQNDMGQITSKIYQCNLEIENLKFT